jgi:hypothetical protein
VLDVEVAHGPPAAVGDPERQLGAPARLRGALRELEREAVLADREAAHRHGLRRHPAHVCGLVSRRPARMDVDPAARERGAGEHQRQHDGEPAQLRDRAHAATAS